jgi:MoaA/NifB/PqqE/SkfB family radical SAM enzyme
MALFFKKLMNQLTAKKTAMETFLTPICLAYLRELVILSNGDVTTCCLDAKGINILGNINNISLEELWIERLLPWHKDNVTASMSNLPWSSKLCRQCIDKNMMSVFNAVRTDNPDLIKVFQKLNHNFPISLVIEPISACNYHCVGCFAGRRELGREATLLDFDSFQMNILPYIDKVEEVRLYNYGEPFMHPRIIDIINALRSQSPCLNIHISTNGMLMNKSISDTLVEAEVNYLTISLHGGHTQEGLMTYSRRGPDIDIIRSNIEYLVNEKHRQNSKLPWICLKGILFYWNDSDEDIEDFIKFGNEIGVDFVGWDLNASDARLSSKRFVRGSEAHESLAERKLLEYYFYQLPVWPHKEKHEKCK